MSCHGAEKPKGKFRVDSLSFNFSGQANRDHWFAVLKRYNPAAMLIVAPAGAVEAAWAMVAHGPWLPLTVGAVPS